MLFFTHLLLGIIAFLFTKDFVHGGNIWIFFGLVVIGSLIPDIDAEESKVNRWSGFIGDIIGFFTSHRGFFHAVYIYLGLALVLSYFFGAYYGAGLLIGYLAHFIGDAITPMGVRPLYPFFKSKISGPIKTGGVLEIVVSILLLGLLVWKLW